MWTITYDVKVTNHSQHSVPAVYNLTDPLKFGGGIAIADGELGTGPTWTLVGSGTNDGVDRRRTATLAAGYRWRDGRSTPTR